jgi:hypothetical protein
MDYSLSFIDNIFKQLWNYNHNNLWDGTMDVSSENPSVVLVPIATNILPSEGSKPQPCIILNKRSKKVRQPGDLCCPGGGVSLPIDSAISKLLLLPKSPLTNWPGWEMTRKKNKKASILGLYFAAGLRECFEEMRLNPLRVKLLGALPPQRLNMFNKTIFPMVIWVPHQQRFKPNWEVERIIFLPLKDLLELKNYARYRLHYTGLPHNQPNHMQDDFPCFVHNQYKDYDLLWGATYRIITSFLAIVFNFQTPDHRNLALYNGQIGRDYMKNGN